MSGFDQNTNYVVSLDTYDGDHLGTTPKFKLKDDPSFAQEERDLILRESIRKGLIPRVENIIFTMYEVKRCKLGAYLVKAEG